MASHPPDAAGTSPDQPRPAARLREAIERRATPEGSEWLAEALAALDASADLPDELVRRFSQALRRLGGDPLAPEGLAFETPGGPVRCGAWSLGDGGRVLLLLRAVARAPDQEAALVAAVYRQGDERERAAVVRGLALLPTPSAHLALALEAGRINSLLLYAALALDNPYAAICYEDHRFNQLVLKALFTGLPVTAIVGLGRRANPELSRMCADYIDERLAARRDVPRDIWLALAPHAGARAEELLTRFLADPDPAHRYYAALAAGRMATRGEGIALALMARRARETERQVLDLLPDPAE